MSALAKAPHWIDIAEQRAESSHNPKLYIGAGLAGALVAGTILNPITAALAAIWGLYAAWEANEAVSDQMEAVEDGIIAHLLDQKQLKQYLAEFGKDQVQMELQVAIARELPLSDAATEAAKRLNLDTTGKTVDRLPGLPPAPQPTGAIGPTTQLNAVEVPAVAPAPKIAPKIAPEIAPSPAPKIATSPHQSATADIAMDLGTNVQNSLIIGKPGSGKGIVVSNAVRAVKQADPGRTVYVIDPKADPLERPYWDGCDCVASKRCAELMPVDIWEWVLSCIREFQRIEGPKLLVIDEIRFLSNAFSRCNDSKTKALDTFWYIVESFTSLGDASRSHVWGVSQSSHTADLKISGGTLGQFRVIALVNTADFGFYDTLTATNIVQRHPDADHLREVVAGRSPRHRVYYDSKFRKWFPLPELQNYSGRDRDTGAETGIQSATLNPRETAKKAIESAFNGATQDTSGLASIRQQYAGNEAFLTFLDWLEKRRDDGATTVSFNDFKNASAFKKLGRSRDDWNTLTTEASLVGLLSRINPDEFQIRR